MNTSLTIPSPDQIVPDKAVIEYALKHGRKEGLLYNNRLLSLYKPANGSFDKNAPSVKAAEERYEANRNWILVTFKN